MFKLSEESAPIDEQNTTNRDSRFVEISSYPRPKEQARTSKNFYELMNARRSIRKFSAEPVEREVLLNAIKTAGTAPSGANCQPWFFALIESQEMREKIRRDAERIERIFYAERAPKGWLSALEPIGTNAEKPYLSVAPALIAVFTRHGSPAASSQEPLKSYYPIESTGIAVGLLLTAIHQVGLATLTHTPRPMSFLNAILGLDGTYRPFILVVTGYPQTPILVPNIKRKALAEICRVY